MRDRFSLLLCEATGIWGLFIKQVVLLSLTKMVAIYELGISFRKMETNNVYHIRAFVGIKLM